MATIVKQFYEAFQVLDAEKMASLYHEDIVFEDPAFGVLNGEQVSNMWRMLCHAQQGKGFQLTFSEVEETETTGQALWEARYTFSRTGRKVHNVITANMTFQDGKIIQHIDQFNLYRWAQQALGLPGWIIGWTPFFRKRLQQQTKQLLRRFEEKRS